MASEAVIFDSCERCYQTPKWFCVGGGNTCLIKVAGLTPGKEIAILCWVGNSDCTVGAWTPAKGFDGKPLVLTSAECVIHLKMPGRYKLDVSEIPLKDHDCPCKDIDCVTVAKQKVDRCELAPLVGNELDGKAVLECLVAIKAGQVELLTSVNALLACAEQQKQNASVFYAAVVACLDVLKKLDIAAAINAALDPYMTECPGDVTLPGADYTSAMAFSAGRPDGTVERAIILPDGTECARGTSPEIIEQMQSKGFIFGTDGVTDYFCPCIAGTRFIVCDDDPEGGFSKAASTALCVPVSQLNTSVFDGKPIPQGPRKALSVLGCFDAQMNTSLSCISTTLKAYWEKFQMLCVPTVCEPLKPPCPVITAGSPEFTVDTDQSVAGEQFNFPLKAEQQQVPDWAVPFALTAPEGGEACLKAIDREALYKIRITAKGHDLTAPNGTTGYNLVLLDANGDPGGTYCGQSATNTFDNSNQTQPHIAGMGILGPLNTAAYDKQDRWIDFEVTGANLLDGLAANSSAFGAVIEVCETQEALCIELHPETAAAIKAACDCE